MERCGKVLKELGEDENCAVFGGTSSRPNSRIADTERSRGGETPETAGLEAPAHSVSSSSEACGAADESHVRRTAAPRSGALCHSGLVAMQRHLGMAEGDVPEVAALCAQKLVVAHVTASSVSALRREAATPIGTLVADTR